MRDFKALSPSADLDYWGSALSFWFLAALTALTTARSLVHMFLADGGASIISGLDTSAEGGDNLIALFGQWGLEQLLLSLVAWVVSGGIVTWRPSLRSCKCWTGAGVSESDC